MPTYLVHGFRWPRALIRIHIILQNLEDCAAEWLMNPLTSRGLTANLTTTYPELLAHLPTLQYIEQYNPDDLKGTEQPYAYVCDQVHEVELGVDIDEVRGQGVANEAWAALADLRDKIAPGEKVGWFVVVCGDVERWFPNEGAVIGEGEGSLDIGGRGGSSEVSPESRGSSSSVTDETKRESKGLKKWLTKARRAKSFKDLRGTAIRTGPMSPPLPNLNRNRSDSDSFPNKPVHNVPTTTNGKAPAMVPIPPTITVNEAKEMQAVLNTNGAGKMPVVTKTPANTPMEEKVVVPTVNGGGSGNNGLGKAPAQGVTAV